MPPSGFGPQASAFAVGMLRKKKIRSRENWSNDTDTAGRNTYGLDLSDPKCARPFFCAESPEHADGLRR